MRDIFKPEDFSGSSDFLAWEEAAVIANKKLNKLIESWPVVYGEFQDNMIVKPFGVIEGITDNHKARLAFVEEIPKEPCKHTVASHRAGNGPWVLDTEYDGSFTCGKCGVKLEMQWKEKESCGVLGNE